MELEISLEDDIETDEIIELYKTNCWSSGEKPEKLIPALKNSDVFGIWQDMSTEGPIHFMAFWQICPEALNVSDTPTLFQLSRSNLHKISFTANHDISNVCSI